MFKVEYFAYITYLFLFLIVISSANAYLTGDCTIKNSCAANEVAIFSTTSTTNAHIAKDPSYANYNHVLCCPGTNFTNSCSGSYTSILKSSFSTNSGVERGDYNTYGINICLSQISATFECSYAASCGANHCIAAISNDTNAHIESCEKGNYKTKVCCNQCVQSVQGTGTERTCYPDDNSCPEGFSKLTNVQTIKGWGWLDGNINTNTSIECRSGAGTCTGGVATDASAVTLFGNGYLTATGTERTCYYGNMTCNEGNSNNGINTLIKGWGWNDATAGDITTDTDFCCREGTPSCNKDVVPSDAPCTTVCGNGYFSSSNATCTFSNKSASKSGYCFSKNPTCESTNAQNGQVSTEICGNGYFSSSNSACSAVDIANVISGYCYTSKITCEDENSDNGAVSSLICGNGFFSSSNADCSFANTATAQSGYCYSQSPTCAKDNAVSPTASNILYGNGIIPASESGFSRKCYHGDINCSAGTSANGLYTDIKGWGFYTGDLTTDKEVNCLSDPGTCGDNDSADSKTYTLYGNGEVRNNNGLDNICYYGNMSCDSNVKNNGSSCTLETDQICVADGATPGCNDCPNGFTNNSFNTCYTECTEGLGNQNDECREGYTCEGSACVSLLEDGFACNEGDDCINLCDNDGVGEVDDGWCFTPANGKYDPYDGKCEESADSSLNDMADEYRAQCRSTKDFVDNDCIYTENYCGASEVCVLNECIEVGEGCEYDFECNNLETECCYKPNTYDNGTCISNLPQGINRNDSAVEQNRCLCMVSTGNLNGSCQQTGDFPCWDTNPNTNSSQRCCGNDPSEIWSTEYASNYNLLEILVTGYCENGAWKTREEINILTYYTLWVDQK